MVVNVMWDKVVDGYATRDIANVNVDEFADITFCLKIRLETLIEKLEEYEQSSDERMKGFIPKTQAKIDRLKNLIELMK